MDVTRLSEPLDGLGNDHGYESQAHVIIEESPIMMEESTTVDDSSAQNA